MFALRTLARLLDPRRSLASAIGWVVFILSIGLVATASVWVGGIVRANFLAERGLQLDQTADRIAGEVNLSLELHLHSIRLLAAMLTTELRSENRATLRRNLENVQRTSPEFAWIGVADAHGRILAATRGDLEDTDVSARSWFDLGLKGAMIGDVRLLPTARMRTPSEIDKAPGSFVALSAALIDPGGRTVGVIGAQLSRQWLLDLVTSLAAELQGVTGAVALLIDRDGTVLIGPDDVKGRRLTFASGDDDRSTTGTPTSAAGAGIDWSSHVERLTDESAYFVSRAHTGPSAALRSLGWHIELRQPFQDAVQPVRTLQGRITAVLLGLGLLAATIGVALARRVTRDLDLIARSADGVRMGSTQHIAVPGGRSEAARLGLALDELLTSLQRERSALQTLNDELDQRVAARTREIERLSVQARHAAVVRERLTIARDLHDTLAHSMMAMLAEVRLLKRIAATNPEAMADELVRAEEAARQGLQEARAAITQMRFNAVRDSGIGTALGNLARDFAERTGIAVEYASNVRSGAFADDRAEALFRIAEEAMRNIERHAGATRVGISLQEDSDYHRLTLSIADNGVGFNVDEARPGHYGLTGLREQAQLIGATLDIRSSPGEGTTIRAEAVDFL